MARERTPTEETHSINTVHTIIVAVQDKGKHSCSIAEFFFLDTTRVFDVAPKFTVCTNGAPSFPKLEILQDVE